MAAFSGFRPFLTQGNTVNGVQNVFFADGTVGAHYIPSESSVYGASGLTNYGESVVALLDRKGLDDVLGPELVSNTTPNFNIIRDSTQSIVYGPGINLTSGKRYLVELEIESNTGNIGISVRVSNSSGNLSPAASISGLQNGKFVFLVRAITTGSLSLNGDNTGVNLILKTLSVREVVNSLYAQQSSASLRPLLGRAPKIWRNTLTYTSEMENWRNIGTGSSLASSSVTNPYDGKTMALFTELAVESQHSINNAVTGGGLNVIAGNTYVFSMVVKRALGTRNLSVGSGSTFVIPLSGYFDFDSITATPASSGTIAGIINLGNGFFRIFTSGTALQTTKNYISLTIRLVGGKETSSTYLGDGSSGFYIGAAQFELGTAPSEYQPVIGNAIDISNSRSYPFIRLDLSDDRLETTNVRSTKNLLLATEEFNESVWSKTNITVTTNAIAGPQGDSSADLITENTANGQHRIEQGGVTGDPKVRHEHSIYVKRASGTRAFQVEIQDGLSNAEQWTFDLENGLSKQTYANSFGFAPTIDILADGWYRIKMGSGIANQGTSFRYVLVMASDYATAQNTYTGDGTSGFYIWGAQIELGSQATDYEYGGFSGSVVVAGRNGSEITYNVKSPLGSFTFGPTTYTGGTPGILRATGDIVGYSLIGRTISDVEKYQLIEYYKSRGAKGILIEGPELLTNGDFLSDTTSWTPGWASESGTFTVSDGILRITAITAGGVVRPRTVQTISGLTIGNVYKISMSGGTSSQISEWGFIWTSNSSGIGGVTSFNRNTNYLPATSTTMYLALFIGTATNGAYGEYDIVSVKEVRPEEEW